jgi:hypothetical protein
MSRVLATFPDFAIGRCDRGTSNQNVPSTGTWPKVRRARMVSGSDLFSALIGHLPPEVMQMHVVAFCSGAGSVRRYETADFQGC